LTRHQLHKGGSQAATVNYTVAMQEGGSVYSPSNTFVHTAGNLSSVLRRLCDGSCILQLLEFNLFIQ